MLTICKGQPSDDAGMAEKEAQTARSWTWVPTWHELTTRYFKEVGFIACLSQMIGQFSKFLCFEIGADMIC